MSMSIALKKFAKCVYAKCDKHYADNRFLALKLHYFLLLDRRRDQKLLLWGAGKKGKQLAQMLLDKAEPFIWACNNPGKIGKDVYGQRIAGEEDIPGPGDFQTIIAVAGETAQAEIGDMFERLGVADLSLFYFC